MKITTTNRPKEMVCFFDLPKKAQSDFDYVEGDNRYSPRFVKYRNAFYDVYDTQRITIHNGSPMGWSMVVQHDNPLSKWDAIVSETYFSGILFKSNSDDMVICGSYVS